MSMKTMYWVSQIFSWNYIDIAGKTHGRIDWFENIRDMGYWWQTGYETGVSYSLDQAKRGVEDAVMRHRMALEARYQAGVTVDPPLAARTGAGSCPASEQAPGGMAWPA
ncbi:hypothetical protein [Bordetella bronchialis]|uniref:Uncharacterized protein n=1 Tax=Bordetella bronchialis TaxID=463025 RepID=A0A193G0N4_9BORD|nr:hypothetical protein [Bordetella bronchialis]ANN68285.1 hypothetical protein BAU06_20055 [Bordetella bronchialis]ANN73425.1 hypothetical protein BAU08_20585 [Bordetella bronchialis]